MEGLSFGEQVKIILSRKNMTIKELAEQIQERTGKAMSRQNLTQRLGRDNFQEKDMRMIAAILGCPFRLSIFPADPEEDEKMMEYANTVAQQKKRRSRKQEEEDDGYQQTLVFEEEPGTERKEEDERDMTIGELYEIHEELKELEKDSGTSSIVDPAETGMPEGDMPEKKDPEEEKEKFHTGGIFLRRMRKEEMKEEENKKKADPKPAEKKAAREVITPDSDDFEPVIKHNDLEEDLSLGEMNPYTGREYQTNSVRMHPTRIGYVQVYDRKQHQWTDMTEWAFLGYQERKKALLGKDYEPPIYLD